MSFRSKATAVQAANVQDQGQVRGEATVFSDYAAVLGARFASAGLSLVSVLLTTRILGASGYGTLAYFGVVSMLIFTVTSAWTSTAVARFGREQLEARGDLLSVSWARAELTAPLLLIAALVVILLKAAGGFPGSFSWTLVWLAVAYGVVWIASEHVVYVLEAVGRMKLSAAALLGQQVTLVVTFAAVLATGAWRSPSAIASMTILAGLAFTVIVAPRVWRQALWPPRHDSEMLLRLVRFSVPMIAFTASQYLIRSVDLVAIGAYGTAAMVGVYAVAYQGYSVLQGLTTASTPVLTPLFVSLRTAGRDEVVRRYFERIVPQLTFVGAVLAAIAVPFVPAAIPIVFGDAFNDAALPLTVLIVAVVLSFAGNLLAPIVVLHERTRAVGIINVVAATINIAGDVVLLGPLRVGVVGPAIATCAAVATVVGGYYLVARACTASAVRPPVFVLAPLGVSLGLSLALPGATGIIVALAGGVVIAAAVARLTDVVRADDADLIAKLDIPGPMKRLTLRTVALAGR